MQLHHRQASGVARPSGWIGVEGLVEGSRIGAATPRHVDAEPQGGGEHLGVVAAGCRGHGHDVVAVTVGRIEVARQQRPHPLEQRHIPADKRLAELLGDSHERGDVAIDGGHVADLEVGHDPEAVTQEASRTRSPAAIPGSTMVSALSRRVIVCGGPAKPSLTAARAWRIEHAGSPTCCARSRASLARCRAIAMVSGLAAVTDRHANSIDRSGYRGVDGQGVESLGHERGLLVARNRNLPRHRPSAHAEYRSRHDPGIVDSPRQLRAGQEPRPRLYEVAGEQEALAFLDHQCGSPARVERPPTSGTSEAPRGLVKGEYPPGRVGRLLPVPGCCLRVLGPGLV